MGLDLTLLPVDHYYINRRTKKYVLTMSSTMLRCEAARLLRDVIPYEPRKLVEGDLYTFRSTELRETNHILCFGITRTDGYDAPLYFLTIGELLDVEQHEDVQNFAANRAAWAWMRAQGDLLMPVVLYWH